VSLPLAYQLLNREYSWLVYFVIGRYPSRFLGRGDEDGLIRGKKGCLIIIQGFYSSLFYISILYL
jgi:hypothetical protein